MKENSLDLKLSFKENSLVIRQQLADVVPEQMLGILGRLFGSFAPRAADQWRSRILSWQPRETFVSRGKRRVGFF